MPPQTDPPAADAEGPRPVKAAQRPRPSGGAAPETAARRDGPWSGWRFGPLLALIFLVYPVVSVLTAAPGPLRALLALAGAAGFAAGFLWLLWTHAPLTAAAPPAEVRVCRAAVALLGALVVALSYTLGPPWGVLYFHVNAAAGLLLRRRDAYVAIGALALFSGALALTTGQPWLLWPTAALGLWATSFAGQVAAVAELRAAREDLARLAVAEERLRFARDLHDLLGHSLSLITLKQELAARLLPASPERAAKEIREAQGVARQALREVREVVAGYRQPTLNEALAGAREMLAAAGIACRIENDAGRLPEAAETLLAWTVREGVTNVIRHSRARRCDVRLGRDVGSDGRAEAVWAEIRDDGRGLTPAQSPPEDGGPAAGGPAGGSGLPGLTERVADVPGGTVDAGPLAGGGFRLRVRLPLSALSALG